MFIGKAASIVSKHQNDSIVLKFQNQVKEAYIVTATCLQKKMPVNNRLLRALSAVDPLLRGSTEGYLFLKRLPKLVRNVLKEEELVNYYLEIRN